MLFISLLSTKVRCREGGTSVDSPGKQHNTKNRHDARLDDEEIPQLRHLEPEERCLEDECEEEAQQLSRGNGPVFRRFVRECIERRPDGAEHRLHALPGLIRLRPKPDHGHNAAHKDGKVASSHAEARACVHGEVDAQGGADISSSLAIIRERKDTPIKHGRNAHQNMANNYGRNGHRGTQALADRA